MTRYLQVSQAKMRSKGIDSVSRVVKIAQFSTLPLPSSVTDSIAAAFVEIYRDKVKGGSS